MKRLLAMLLLFCCVGLSQAQQSLEVIKLYYRTADQVLPKLRPFLEPGGVLSGMNNQIFVRASPANRQQIKELLASLDVRPRRLMITVRQEGERSATVQSAEASGSVGIGQVRITQPGSRDGKAGATVEIRRGDDLVRGRINDSRGSVTERGTQQLQVVEGGKAYIHVGASVPVQLHQLVLTPAGVIVSDTVVYRDIGSGFYAEPSLSGDSVTLEISTANDTSADLGAGSANVQRLSTTLSARLGEWMEIGGVTQEQNAEQGDALRSSTRAATDTRRVLLKVEEVR